jgi:superfamily I DNA/RNA helicase
VFKIGNGTQAVVRRPFKAKQSQNVLDYDDLLLYWAEMMSDPAKRASRLSSQGASFNPLR